jgi:hypothetical protein
MKEKETPKQKESVAKEPKANNLFIQISDDCKVMEIEGVGVVIATTVGCTFATGAALKNVDGKYYLTSKRNK